MSASLSSSVRSVVVAALPPGTAPADPTDEDLVRGLAACVGTLRATILDLTAQPRALAAPPATSSYLDAVLAALAGDESAPAALPEGPARRAVEEALAVRKRADAAAAALDDARRKPAPAGSDRVSDLFARAVHCAAQEGRVPDDLPAGSTRALVEEVANLRSALDRARSDAESAAKLAKGLEQKLAERQRRAETRRGPTEAEAAARVAEADRVIKEAAAEVAQKDRELHAARRAREMAEQESKHRIHLVEAAEQLAEDARAIVSLAAHALGLPPGAAAEDVLAALHAYVSTADERATAKATLTPPPAPKAPPLPEPAYMRECEWHKLQPGDLALDRGAYRHLRLRAAAADHPTLDAPQPTDDDRRVLVLRDGDRLVWLRGDGLHADGVTADEAPAHKPTRRFRAASPWALVIAEDIGSEPNEVAEAWQAWLRAAEVAPGLDRALDDHPPTADEHSDVLPTSAGSAATIRSSKADS